MSLFSKTHCTRINPCADFMRSCCEVFFHQDACAVLSKFLCLSSLYVISPSIQLFSATFLRSWTYRPALPGLHVAWNPSAPSWELWWTDDTHYIVILYHFRWHARHEMFVNPCVMDATRFSHPCVMTNTRCFHPCVMDNMRFTRCFHPCVIDRSELYRKSQGYI